MTIRVASALIFQPQSGRALFTLRPDNVIRPSVWELPGGKAEPGETERDCLVREIREELGVPIEVGELVSVARFWWDEAVLLMLYHCRLVSGIPQPLASQEIRWMDVKYVRQYMPSLPAYYSWYPDIHNFITNTQQAFLKESTDA